LSGHTVVGGLDKLVQAFFHEKQPDDLMTYADRDWSDGESYLRLGFECIGETPPQTFWVHPSEKLRIYGHRLPFSEEEMRSRGYFPIFNMGNLKFLKKFHI
jgi:hypothetical protein